MKVFQREMKMKVENVTKKIFVMLTCVASKAKTDAAPSASSPCPLRNWMFYASTSILSKEVYSFSFHMSYIYTCISIIFLEVKIEYDSEGSIKQINLDGKLACSCSRKKGHMRKYTHMLHVDLYVPSRCVACPQHGLCSGEETQLTNRK